MASIRPRLVRAALRDPCLHRRSIANTSQRTASVLDQKVAPSSQASSSSSKAEEDVRPLRASIYGSKELLEAKKERKFAQYEKSLAEKAKSEGYTSVAELRARQEEIRIEAARINTASQEAHVKKIAGMTEADSKVATEIRKRAEAAAERKIKSGDFSSGPGIKALSDIIDVSKVEADSPAKISQLWTQYHTLKNKISAVIPAKQYAEMAKKARQYPNFLLPLPRTIVGSLDQTETANVAPGEQKQGYEMQYLQWSFLPPPEQPAQGMKQQGKEKAISFSKEERQLIQTSAPSTVLFTPLAEYKLRQEYAQPVLILTHYTDLALSKGIVLLRGEVTGADEAAAAVTGIAAAAIASQAGETSKEKLEVLKKPLQSQGKITPQDAQLLTVTLQRFYMPKVEDAMTSKIAGEKERQELLDAFHKNHDKFDIDRLCTYSLLT